MLEGREFWHAIYGSALPRWWSPARIRIYVATVCAVTHHYYVLRECGVL